MKQSISYLNCSILLIFLVSCSQNTIQKIDLAGTWSFQTDPTDVGIEEQWYIQNLTETVSLPGSMVENGKGEDITLNTRWTGQVVDSSWFTSKRYEPYRKAGNIKIPFWLQPEKHYLGASWYQKNIKIPNDWKSKSITLKLERPHWETQVWIDDQHLGMRNTLGTAQKYSLTKLLKPGNHLLTIRVDNRVKDIDPGMNSHSISDHTQSNWNGIVGELTLTASPLTFIEDVQIFPDIDNKVVRVKAKVNNLSGKKQLGKLIMIAQGPEDHPEIKMEQIVHEFEVANEEILELIYPMGESPRLWDEFHPYLYTMNLELRSPIGVDQNQVVFGMREFKVDGTHFVINDRPVFLRGTLECAIFPKTGYPSTDVKDWRRILQVCKAHGLNHMRFHSWCPPEAAFIAADELGVYLQVECSSWANSGSSVGAGKPIDDWLLMEAEKILQDYGNHPSFCLMAYGNEPAGKNQVAYLSKFVAKFRSQDNRRVYTGGAGWPYFDTQDYYNNAAPRIQGWGQQLSSIINKEPPQTQFDYEELIQKTPMPYVSHEIGQWCVYPNFQEISKYTGVLKAKNFEIFRETLEANQLGHLADSFLIASGKLQALCYKADIEAALRTKDFAGFQLLDLHDFPGQGTALVGVLDAFWEEKGYITPQEYSHFCNETVPLVRLEKRIFNNQETLKAGVEIAHFGEKPLENTTPSWTLTDDNQQTVSRGVLPKITIPLGNGIELGEIVVDLNQVKQAKRLQLTVEVAGFENSWDIWVYPSDNQKLQGTENLKVVSALDHQTIKYLESGGNVLLTTPKGSLKPEKGGEIGIGFSSIFWNTAWTRGQKPHTLGILCDPQHPALQEFPTEFHSNWQWWDAMSHSNAIILDEFTADLQPIVRVIDDWFKNRRLGLIFEAKVGRGKLIVCSIDLLTKQQQRPEAQQLLYSLQKYMLSDDFEPRITLEIEKVQDLY